MNITNLTIHAGLPSIEFNCQCMIGNNILDGTSWFLGNTLVAAQGKYNLSQWLSLP